MAGSIDLIVDNTDVTVEVPVAAGAAAYTCVVTQNGAAVFTSTRTVVAGEHVKMTQTFGKGKYHLTITGPGGATFDADFTVPTTPKTTIKMPRVVATPQ